MSKETMARHHDEIVTAASRLLRERGIEGTSVADLMQAAGLTHGGFYRHFDSKDALVAEAAQSIYENLVQGLATKAEKLGEADAVADYVEKYLTRHHVSHPGAGCVMAALGVEAARQGADVQRVFANGTQRTIDKLAAGLSGTPAERRVKAIRTLATLVGAVVIARAVGEGALSEEVLASNREALALAGPRKR
ncbi:MAG: TetR/AcrR family transcriptional regulator [Hyphomicrobium sp.]|uniref:TetR/AcrR family transcriptional regulator n=1 Tax=Hyphomicrobium sp. TaxID=82 RepID=UPI0025BB2BC5|nr:helix-turn-helix domain-containing protein [Hyphomicrobium sp.]MBZ0208208.1 TetR/AcrR family transcriptional regulator [Hyphomicrobium sp.]